MPVPLAHESASNAGGSARSPPLGRQAGHARRGRARRTLHPVPVPGVRILTAPPCRRGIVTPEGLADCPGQAAGRPGG